MKNAQRLFPDRVITYEFIVITIEVRRNRKGVGENPLNGKGTLLARNGEDEEIVYSHAKV